MKYYKKRMFYCKPQTLFSNLSIFNKCSQDCRRLCLWNVTQICWVLFSPTNRDNLCILTSMYTNLYVTVLLLMWMYSHDKAERRSTLWVDEINSYGNVDNWYFSKSSQLQVMFFYSYRLFLVVCIWRWYSSSRRFGPFWRGWRLRQHHRFYIILGIHFNIHRYQAILHQIIECFEPFFSWKGTLF